MKNILLKVSKIITYLPHVFKVLTILKNPITFVRGYFHKVDNVICFYNGLRFKTENQDDISSISAIFVKSEYGKTIGSKAQGLTIIDIGANKGYFTLKAANNPLNKVYAYEPIASTFKALEANISLNQATNVKTYNVGVARKNEVREFNFSTDKSIISSMVFTQAGQTKKIPCITLADVFTENQLATIDLLKMDCEGAEFEILYNTTPEVLSKIKVLRMEYHDFESEAETTFNINHLTEYLAKMNFKLVEKRPASSTLGIAWFENQKQA